jgi:hypothetical protein
MSRKEFNELARLGAKERLEEIRLEKAWILKVFPDLAPAPAVRPSPPVDNKDNPPQPRQRRRRMSAAAREAVSKRMKKYWAAQRKIK